MCRSAAQVQNKEHLYTNQNALRIGLHQLGLEWLKNLTTSLKRQTLLDCYTILEILPNSQRTDANVVVTNKCLTKVTKVKNYCEKYKAKTYIYFCIWTGDSESHSDPPFPWPCQCNKQHDPSASNLISLCWLVTSLRSMLENLIFPMSVTSETETGGQSGQSGALQNFFTEMKLIVHEVDLS